MQMNKWMGATGALALGLSLTAATTTVALAAEYPTKPITMLIGYKAGGGTDTVGRVFVKKFGEVLGQQVNIVNQPGAGGGVAAMKVKREM